MEITEINFLDIREEEKYKEVVNSVLKKCFEEEKLIDKNIYVNIVLTNSENIQEINKKFRGIDKATDVLSFPMFEKEEILNLQNNIPDVLGDIVISIQKVKEQAIEYDHSFIRELAYMLVHGFYHLMGYDHMAEDEKTIMRKKEENILNKLNILK